MVRIRFAPSPTGHLHVGGARTALFNWLWARHQGGVFILRIEDTDRKRSKPEFTKSILESLRWLGLDWDEGPEISGPNGPYFQSQRQEIHREAAFRLLEAGKAYRCFCSPAELQTQREKAKIAGRDPQYDRRCRHLAPETVKAYLEKGKPHALRFEVPAGEVFWRDLIRGEVRISLSEIEDFVLMKSDGSASYLLAAAVDDLAMGITHIIRGEDHISNTPKQILIFRALEGEIPQFAHLPLILGPDKSRLSKRHGATAVIDYKQKGILPQALVNHLALLGWSTPDSRQIFSLDELVTEFSLDRVNKTGAVFDYEKLLWLNSQHIMALPLPRRTESAIPFLVQAGLISPEEAASKKEWLSELVDVIGDRMKTLDQIVGHSDFLFSKAIDYLPSLLTKIIGKEGVAEALEAIADKLSQTTSFTVQKVEEIIREEASRRGLGAGKVIQGVRLTISGKEVTPPLFETVVLLGQKETVRRLRNGLESYHRQSSR